MSSSTHLPGAGLRPALIGSRSIEALLERNRQQTADARWVEVVRSLGGGVHLVKDFCNDAVYPVGSAQGALSYRPGQVVAVMSHSGTPGEVIVAQPPPGRAGASAFPVDLGVRSLTFNVSAPVSCPQPITGRSYLGVYDDAAATTLHAWLYQDGNFLSVAGTFNYAGLLTSHDSLTWQRVHTSGDLLIFQARRAGTDRVGTWDVDAGTLVVADTGIGTIAGPVWAGGADVYFTETFLSFPDDEQVVQLRKAAIGASGLLDYELSKVGAPMQDPTLSSPNILCGTGGTWEKPSFDDPGSDEVACPYFSGGAWQTGRGRVLANPTNPGVHGHGYPVNGGRAARVMFLASGNYTVALLPAGPGSPEVAIVPDGWALPQGFGLSVSPAGTQFAAYPVVLAGDGPPADKLLRLSVQPAAFPGECPVPRLTVEPGPNGQVPFTMHCRD